MKTLIIHASAGAGHTKAAEALYNGLSKTSHEAVLVDALDYTSPFYKKSYQKTYTILITYFPWAWGFFFALIDVPVLRGLVRVLRRAHNMCHGPKLAKFLINGHFDCIISTHFFSTEVAAALKHQGRIASKLITVVTDFDVHSIWLAEGVDHYAVASDFTKEKIKSLGVAAEHVTVTGIPTHEKFSALLNRSEIRRKMGLQDAFTVMVATGSFGTGPIEAVIAALKDYQVIVICGHNQGLFSRLSKLTRPGLKVYQLVDNMEEVMAASDVMISKPGGLSISEAMVRNLPLIFFSAIPGQETNNVLVLRKYGLGLGSARIPMMIAEIKLLSSSPEKLTDARKKTQALAKPNAVNDIIKLIQ